jgi:hypothetical protein
VRVILDHTEDASIGPQPEHHIPRVQTRSHDDRTGVHSVLFEALSPKPVRLAAQQILPRIGNHKRECPIVCSEQLLLCRFKILSLSEPDLSARQRVPVYRIHDLARDAKLRGDVLGTKVGCDSTQQHKRKQAS